MVAGSGLPKNWWTRQEKVTVNFAGQQGFLLNRYMLYELVTEVCVLVLLRVRGVADVLGIAKCTGDETVLGVCVLVGLLGATIPFPTVTPASTEAYRT